MSQERIKSVMINAIEAIKADPNNAKGVFAAQVDWIDGASCSAEAQSSSPLDFNETTYETIIESPESGETLRSLVKRAEAHCPVLDSVIHPVNVLG